MKLYIDTTDSNKIVIGFDKKRFETEAVKKKSQKLLSFIDELLSKEKKDLSDVSSIEVAVGHGSFTGIRVGLSVAQSLGWVLGVKVNGKDLNRGEKVDISYED